MAQNKIEWVLAARDQASAVFKQVEAGMIGIQGAYGRLSLALGTLAGVGIFAKMRAEAMEAEQASNRLNAVLIATGQSAGLTKKQIDGLADSMAQSTQFDDESIRNAASTFIKFGNIQGDVFKSGMKYAADWAAFTGGDMTSAAQAIGKALQSPTEGLKAIERETGKLTWSEKEHVKTLMESGRLLEAQGVILRVLEKRIGGVAEKMNTGLSKQTSDLTKNFNELWEAAGKSSGGSSFLDTANQALRDMKAIIESGDWVAAYKMLWGFRGEGLNIKAPIVSSAEGPIRGTAGDPEVGARVGQLNAVIEAAREKDATVRKEREKAARKAAEEALRREENLKKEGTAGWVKYADEVFREADELNLAMAKINQEYWDEEKKLKDKGTAGWIAYADKVFELADEENLALAKIADEANRMDPVMRNLGFTMTSAFEDAALGALGLTDRMSDARDVARGLLADIARVMMRQQISDPLAKMIGGIDLKGLFNWGGGNATVSSFTPDYSSFTGAYDIPAFASGTDYVPRTGLAYVHEGERITPAGQNRGGGVTNHFTVDMRGASLEAVARLEQLVMKVNGSIEHRAVRAVADARMR